MRPPTVHRAKAVAAATATPNAHASLDRARLPARWARKSRAARPPVVRDEVNRPPRMVAERTAAAPCPWIDTEMVRSIAVLGEAANSTGERPRTSAKLVAAVTAPLGLFVLALLIVESFLAAPLVFGGLDATNQLVALWMGVGMFFAVILVVALIVWNKPENLTFDKQAHLKRSKAAYGTDSRTVADRDALLPAEPDKAGES